VGIASADSASCPPNDSKRLEAKKEGLEINNASED
jgi:hypothetical protein